MKKCSRCKEPKSDNQFNRNKALSDGLQSQCRDCTKKYYRQEPLGMRRCLWCESRFIPVRETTYCCTYECQRKAKRNGLTIEDQKPEVESHLKATMGVEEMECVVL